MYSKYLSIRDIILKYATEAGNYPTILQGIRFIRHDKPTEFIRCFYSSTCVLVLQGEKSIYYGSHKLVYGRGQYVVSSTDIPVSSSVTQANHDEPLVVLMLEFDTHALCHVIAESNIEQHSDTDKKLLGIAQVDAELLDAFYRLVRLVEKSQSEQYMLYPIILKEIYYRLLIGPLGKQLRLAHTKGTSHHQITQAIAFLKENYREKLSMETIAEHINMPLSSFYRSFREVTQVSPLQYQKQLRLYEAQRLLLAGECNVESASYSVGYESTTQFTREYKKMFGSPPRTHIKHIIEK